MTVRGEVRDERIFVCLEATLKREAARIASEDSRSLSDWVRMTIRNAVAKAEQARAA
jgi:hypothetical protein